MSRVMLQLLLVQFVSKQWWRSRFESAQLGGLIRRSKPGSVCTVRVQLLCVTVRSLGLSLPVGGTTSSLKAELETPSTLA